MNNFERIKQMTLDEMAMFLTGECRQCPLTTLNDCIKSCLESKKSWLQQEAKN